MIPIRCWRWIPYWRRMRLPNGTAAEKVPGISLDNALYDIRFGDDLAHNFRGGIKMVRTAYFNAIGMNSLLDNNDGSGSTWFHFFEIDSAPHQGAHPNWISLPAGAT